MANHHAAVLPLALDFGPDPGPAGAMYTELLLPEVSQGPGLTEEEADRVAQALRGSKSPGTRKAYTRSFNRFEVWCRERGFPALPSKPEVVTLYLADAGLRLATLRSDRAGISDAHRRAGEEDLAAHAGVKEALAGLARADTRPQRQAKPLNADALGPPPSGRQAGARRRGDLRCAPGRAAPPLRSG